MAELKNSHPGVARQSSQHDGSGMSSTLRMRSPSYHTPHSIGQDAESCFESSDNDDAGTAEACGCFCVSVGLIASILSQHLSSSPLSSCAARDGARVGK
eukprot:3739782-Pleurochrysis_carterae.AAC.2